ncbi:MAG: hypothetical protein KBB54_02925 [Candidatus Pacebacteria bacterium]|nr:hypothetical protein [Candidatus Paceibacterota bacterium]MBP9819074.1 hypothetical protein [Candidatus Paceibacterota bacterium]
MITKDTLAVEFVQEFLDQRESLSFRDAVQATLAQYPAAKCDDPIGPGRIVFSDGSVVVLELTDPKDAATATMVVGE